MTNLHQTIRLIFCVTAVILVSVACKKGCTDPDAWNYDPDAKKDHPDQPCQYDYPPKDSWFKPIKIDGVIYNQLTGSITGNRTMTAGDNWVISGGVFVTDGATLTIEAGTSIFAADDGTSTFLSILQGGKIMAEGTATAPIVFKPIANHPQPGEWVGIIINGKAPVTFEAQDIGLGGTGTFGGSDPNDNSGILNYVRLEYTGKGINTGGNSNGFSFNGVGSGTQLNYLQTYRGSGDAFKFYGGNAHLKYAIATGHHGDAFDWKNGWTGKGQFWVAEQSDDAGDRGFEGGSLGNNHTIPPLSNPTISNVTLIGTDDGDSNNQGIKLREGTQGHFYNIIVTGFPKKGCQVQHDATIAHMDNGDLTLKSTIIDNAIPLQFTSSTVNDTIVNNNFTQSQNQNQFASDGSLTGFLTGFIGTSNTGAYHTSALDTWFTNVNYIGAVRSDDNWTLHWSKSL